MGRAEARLILKGRHPHPLAKASASDKPEVPSTTKLVDEIDKEP
jgi:hypothetical protein